MDNLLKLATVIQRIMNKQVDAVDDTSLLSEDEKEELMASLEDAAASLQGKSDEIESSMTKVRKQVNE